MALRLKWLVLLTVVGVQLAAAALIVGATWQAASEGAAANARESMHRLGSAARDRFHRFIAPAEEASRLLRRLLAEGVLDGGDREHVERLLSEPLKVHTAFDAVYLGKVDGDFLYVTRGHGGDGYLVKEIRQVDGHRRVEFRRRDPDFNLIEAWEDPDDLFDPRLRPWFSAATDVESALWTSPYVFFTSRQPGVSTATAMVDPVGGAWGAVAVDIQISAFAAMLSELSVGPEVAFVVDRDGEVVALPEKPERWPQLFSIDSLTGNREIAAPGFRSLVAAAARSGGMFGEIAIDGQPHWIDLQSFDNLSPPWLMAVAVPSDALFDWVRVLRDRIVLATVAMAMLAAALMLIAWRFNVERPVAAVTERLRRIAEGGTDPREVLRGPSEFRDLDAAAADAGRRIKERDQANRSLVATLREYEHAVRQSPVGIAILESDGRVVFANETYRRMIGPSDPLGETPRLFAAADRSGMSIEARMATARAGRTAREDVITQRADDGSSAVLQGVLAPLLAEDEAPEGRAVLVVEDVTARKRVEQRLVEARNVAERSDRAKSAFLAQMSHELRTPLNAIIGFSEVMRAGVFGPIGSPRYVEYIGHIESSARHLKDLIDRVLDLSRIEQGGLRVVLEEIDIEPPVRQAVDMVGPAAAAAGVSLAFEVDGGHPPGRISADAAAVRQIVVNLISNAVKFSPRGSRVVATLCGTVDGGVEIEVADQGIGIAQEDLPHVFEPFWQGGSAWESGRVGVGLGLAIVRSLVDQHGGRVDIDSAPGSGTRVRVRLPADPAAVLASVG